MARNKPTSRKRRLGSAGKKSKPVPTWVVGKTKGAVRSTHKSRHWRRTKLNI